MTNTKILYNIIKQAKAINGDNITSDDFDAISDDVDLLPKKGTNFLRQALILLGESDTPEKTNKALMLLMVQADICIGSV